VVADWPQPAAAEIETLSEIETNHCIDATIFRCPFQEANKWSPVSPFSPLLQLPKDDRQIKDNFEVALGVSPI
jgi:hypothetical protein